VVEIIGNLGKKRRKLHVLLWVNHNIVYSRRVKGHGGRGFLRKTKLHCVTFQNMIVFTPDRTCWQSDFPFSEIDFVGTVFLHHNADPFDITSLSSVSTGQCRPCWHYFAFLFYSKVSVDPGMTMRKICLFHVPNHLLSCQLNFTFTKLMCIN